MSKSDFDKNLAFHKKVGGSKALIVEEPAPPSLEEIEAWKKAKNAGGYEAHWGDDGKLQQIHWKRSVDHDLFMRWIQLRKRG